MQRSTASKVSAMDSSHVNFIKWESHTLYRIKTVVRSMMMGGWTTYAQRDAVKTINVAIININFCEL